MEVQPHEFGFITYSHAYNNFKMLNTMLVRSIFCNQRKENSAIKSGKIEDTKEYVIRCDHRTCLFLVQ